MVVLPDKTDYGSFTDEPSTTSSFSNSSSTTTSTRSSPAPGILNVNVNGNGGGPGISSGTDGLSSSPTNANNYHHHNSHNRSLSISTAGPVSGARERNNILRNSNNANSHNNHQILNNHLLNNDGLKNTGIARTKSSDSSSSSNIKNHNNLNLKSGGGGACASGVLNNHSNTKSHSQTQQPTVIVTSESPTRRRLVSTSSSTGGGSDLAADRTLTAVCNTGDSVIITLSNNNNNNHQNSQVVEKDTPSSPGSSPASSPMSNSSNDFHQRQPLLQEAKLTGGCNGWDDDDSPLDEIDIPKDSKRNGSAIRINIPPPESTGGTSGGKRFPEERLKTVIAFGWLSFNFMLATVSLALTHERLPDPKTSNALPDIILDSIEPQDWALTVSEVLLSASTFAAFGLLLFHRYRWIVFRRVFFILGCLYLMRSLTMYVTVLPVASRSYALNVCASKANTTSVWVIATRAIKLMSGFGLSMNGQHVYCGDYMYSGHTVVLVASYLVIKEYSSKRCYILHWISFAISSVGVIMILWSRGHYTVDVLVAYYVTTRLFWMYHTMANNPVLRNATPTNYLSRLWWFPVFRYLEGNVNGPVPRAYSCPSACFNKLYRRFRRNGRL